MPGDRGLAEFFLSILLGKDLWLSCKLQPEEHKLGGKTLPGEGAAFKGGIPKSASLTLAQKLVSFRGAKEAAKDPEAE